MGRPKLEFDDRDHRLVLVMARLGASNTDIAAEFDIDRGTVDRHFGDSIRAGRVQRQLADIERLFELARRGSVRAMIKLERAMRRAASA